LPQEKTEKATVKRRQDERKKGNIFQSRDVAATASLIILFFALSAMAPRILYSIIQATRRIIGMAGEIGMLTFSDVRRIGTDIMVMFATTVLPLLLLSVLVSTVITLAQTKLLFTTKTMQFKFSRLNPLNGLRRMFSLRALVELSKTIIKIVVLGYIIYRNLYDKILLLPRLMDMSPEKSISYLGDLVMSIVSSSAAVFVFIAALDYFYQWWDYEKSIRMSKEEIKEEYKETEGDPQVRGRIKERQRKMSQMRMMQMVPEADVVIRNPNHYAVALKYDPDKNRAPVVLAKGADKLALRIIAEAEKHGIIVTENKPLARALYESVEVDSEIPAEFYQAVAEVLVYVYNLKGEKIAHN
jgi:flagellar biosynthetic protein FlhB